MHGSPSCAIAVGRFGVWRAAVGTVAALALGSLAAWLITAPQGGNPWVRAAIAAAALATLALAISLWRVSPVRLLWDGLVWSVAPASEPEAATPGTLDVAVDLGAFLLLRFVPAGRSGPAAVRWIPVGRAGLEPEWHAFRCALYSPRPAAADRSQA
jgi:hypothetical protein